jgi:uncharacterized protein (DUF2141 family)
MSKNLKSILQSRIKATKIVAAITPAILLFGFTPKNGNPTLTIQVNKVQKKGTLYVSVCTKSSEWSSNGKYTFKYKPVLGQANNFEINTIPNGNYAIALYQDQNGNGKLDTNFFGIPTEPYAFSNNKAPVFSEPSFEDCKFLFNKQSQQISINLLNK